MANSVDAVIGSEAIKQVENLISKLSLADAELIKISQSASTASKGITGISTPSGLDKAVTNTAALNVQLEKQNAIITKLHADIAKKAEQSRLAEIQLDQAREKSFDNYSKKLAKKEADELAASNKIIAQKEKEFAIFEKQFNKYEADIAKKAIAEEKASQKAIQAAIKQQLAEEKQSLARRTAFDKNTQKLEAQTAKELSSYSRIQTSVNLLTKTYNDLAIRKELGNTLTAKEEIQLIKLSSRINTYQAALLKVDSQIGKNQRNVGNYASGYNALGNSINQLSREAPAFANSVNTGFMALSNNFPALFDAINGIRDKNKMLVAEGKPTVSVFKSIAGAVFSWQTLLSVGVTLLTLYGGQFVKWVTEMTKGKETISDLKLRMDTLNKSFEESSVKEAVKNVQELAINIDLAKRGFLDKQKVVDQYNETIGKTTGLVTNLDDAEKELTANGDAYIKMTLYKAAANLALEEAAKQSLEAEKSRLKSLKDFQSVSDEISSSLKMTTGTGDALSVQEYQELQEKRTKAQNKRKAEEIKISTDAAQQNINIAKKFQEDAAKIAQDFDFNLFGDTKKATVKKAAQAKAKRDDLDHLESYIKPVGTIVDEINKEISRLTTEKIIANEDELPEINAQLKTMIELKKTLAGATPVGGSLPNAVVVDDTPKMQKLKTDWKDTFDSIAESAQQAGDIIAEFSQRNFDNEYRRLEAQKDISLRFAGDSAEARKKIEEDYEKKRKEIANRENKAKQKQAIFNIAIDTAQAVMKAAPNVYLMAAMAAIGIAQGILVSTAKVPEYFAGTENHTGGLMLVNDGGGSNYQEKVILPNGKEVMPEGRNVLMNAPKGTKVLTHEQQIREMLNERGISMSKSYQSNGMTAQEMDSVMGKHFAKIQTNNTVFDKKGFSSWAESNGNKTRQNANRVSRTGFKV